MSARLPMLMAAAAASIMARDLLRLEIREPQRSSALVGLRFQRRIGLSGSHVNLHLESPIRRISARASKESTSKGEAFYNYLTQSWEFRAQGMPIPWAEAATSLTDFLPWSDADRRALAILEEKVPRWRDGVMMPNSEAGVRRRFRIITEVVGGEEAGLSALERNIGVLCVGEQVSKAASKALVTGLGPAKAAEVVQKNPGVLAIRASSLQGDGLTRTVLFANVIDFFVGPGRLAVNFLQLLVVVSLSKAVFDVVFLPNGLIRALPPS